MTDAVEAPSAGAGKRPVQQRSRERVERMLAAATELIAAKGSDALKMSEVAERAGVPIGSLYQFFPDKGAIIHRLAERCAEESRDCIATGLADVRDVAGFERAFRDLYDLYYRIFLAQPARRDIWFAVQADKALRAMEIAESRYNGAVLAGVLKRLRPDADEKALEASAFLVMSLGEATVRLAVSVERAEGERLMEGYKRMAVRELLGA
ncbi:MAG: TetR family transcriptional regulator [Rhizobiaceae bacterium]|nr:TetR family transcriptional regulator [Rhizobiaceae bacterium]MCV0405695.1 TetR family transcriptional regulator [Rhizobiaceae bacterium]